MFAIYMQICVRFQISTPCRFGVICGFAAFFGVLIGVLKLTTRQDGTIASGATASDQAGAAATFGVARAPPNSPDHRHCSTQSLTPFKSKRLMG